MLVAFVRWQIVTWSCALATPTPIHGASPSTTSRAPRARRALIFTGTTPRPRLRPVTHHGTGTRCGLNSAGLVDDQHLAFAYRSGHGAHGSHLQQPGLPRHSEPSPRFMGCAAWQARGGGLRHRPGVLDSGLGVVARHDLLGAVAAAVLVAQCGDIPGPSSCSATCGPTQMSPHGPPSVRCWRLVRTPCGLADPSRRRTAGHSHVDLRCRSRARTRAGAGAAGSGRSRASACSRSRSR